MKKWHQEIWFRLLVGAVLLVLCFYVRVFFVVVLGALLFWVWRKYHFTAKIRIWIAMQKAENERREREELARKEKILSGMIDSITTTFNLKNGEAAYLQFNVDRIAEKEYVETQTVSKAKKQGVLTRAIVGGVLLGPLGALGGAATAGEKGTGKTTYNTVKRNETIDSGTMVFTNKRILFVGKAMFSIYYDNIVSSSFACNILTIKYPEMMAGEYFRVYNCKDCYLYFKGITNNLVKLEMLGLT